MKKKLAALVTLLTCGSGQEALAAAAQNAPGPKRYDYDGTGTPDAAMVRRVAETLGVGKTVTVKATSSKKLRAKIQSTDVSNFTVTHGRSSTPVVIAYDEVTQLKPAGLRLAAKIAICFGIFYGAVQIIGPLSGAVASN